MQRVDIRNTKERAAWSLTAELRFVDKLGTWNDWKSTRDIPPSRAELLRGYLRGLAYRVDMTDTQKRVLRNRVAQLLGVASGS